MPKVRLNVDSRLIGEASSRHVVLALLTGLLSPLCFPHFDLALLAWVVLVPLHLAVEEVPPRRAFWLGWLAGVVGFAGTMSWVVTAMNQYGKMPLVAAYAVMGLLVTYLGLYTALYALAVTWIRRALPVVGLWSAPVIWVALEWVRTHLFSGLPWALLGYSQYRWLPVIQIADHTGVYGVSFVLVLVNVALAEAAGWGRRRWYSQPSEPFPWPRAAAAAGILLVTVSYGIVLLQDSDGSQPEGAAAGRPVTIGVVQANIDQGRKWDAIYRNETLRQYARLTSEVAGRADLIVWPEAATPFLFEEELAYRAQVTMLVQFYGAPLLFGSPAVRRDDEGRPYLLNSAYLLGQDGQIAARYDKMHLVPFGEYVPLRPVLFFLDKLVEGIGDFQAGTVPTVFELPLKAAVPGGPETAAPRFGTVICFEVIFPALVREFVHQGADFMVTITNDAWFGASAAPYQHFGMVVLRAVENHVPFARAANTGISGFIDPYGRVLAATKIFEALSVTGRLEVGNRQTFYTRHGDVFARGCAIIAAIFLGVARVRRTRAAPRRVAHEPS
jgi:apolipoprotein N-acyltransferase